MEKKPTKKSVQIPVTELPKKHRTTGKRDGLGEKKIELRLGPEREAALDALCERRYALTGKKPTRVAMLREAVDALLHKTIDEAEVKA